MRNERVFNSGELGKIFWPKRVEVMGGKEDTI
jgi:hypothetical protein